MSRTGCTEVDGQIQVFLDDRITVRRGYVVESSRIESGYGQLFGDWYVRVADGPDLNFCTPPDRIFMVGHNPTGQRLLCDLTYWEAVRVALAMQDANPKITPVGEPADDPDIMFVLDSIIASALMDHYVFPLCNYPELMSEVACT